MKGFFQEFKKFALKGNVMDLAIGVVIGAAFGRITNSLVGDIINPLLGLLTNKVKFSELVVSIGSAQVKYGMFINALIEFVIISFVIFLIVRQINRWREKDKPAANMKTCPYCKTNIHLDASRCPNCTSALQS